MSYVPSTPQINTWSSDWVQFYAEERLGFQLRLALDQYGDRTIYEKGEHCCLENGTNVCWLTAFSILVLCDKKAFMILPYVPKGVT